MCLGVNLATAGMPILLSSLIECFQFQTVGPKGQILKGKDMKVSMEERSGLPIPRAYNLMCFPVS